MKKNDDDLLIKLSFFIYTEVRRLLSLNNSNNPGLIFELELMDDKSTFEQTLKTLLNQLTDKEFDLMDSRSCLKNNCNENDLNEWTKLDNDCKLCEIDLVDIGQVMSKPILTHNTEEYLIRSLKIFANNLSKLNSFTYDPFTEANEDAEFGYGQADVLSFACLLFSYYSMGSIQIKKFLFENEFQFLYDSNVFYNDFDITFRNDLIISDEKKCSNRECAECLSFKKSKWSFTKTSHTKTEVKKIENNRQHLSTIDEILNRISNLDSQNFFNSYFTLINNEELENDCRERLLQQRGWTVAPKLFSSNTINHLDSECFHSAPDNITLASNPATSEHRPNWFKSEMKPIGFKPASMFTTSFQHQVQRRLNKSALNTSSNLNQNFKAEKNLKNIWNNEENANDLKDLFIHHEVPNNNDEDCMTHTKIKPVITTSRINNNNNNNNQNKPAIKVTGKYSVAPLNINQKRKNKSSNDSSFHRGNNFKADFNQMQHELMSFKSSNYTNSNQLKYPNQRYGGHTVNGGYEERTYEDMNNNAKFYQSYNVNNFKRPSDSSENNRYQHFNKNRYSNR